MDHILQLTRLERRDFLPTHHCVHTIARDSFLGTGKDGMEGMKVKEGFLDIVLLNANRLSAGIAQAGSILPAPNILSAPRFPLYANRKGGIHA
jgi:hypothetical protein